MDSVGTEKRKDNGSTQSKATPMAGTMYLM